MKINLYSHKESRKNIMYLIFKSKEHLIYMIFIFLFLDSWNLTAENVKNKKISQNVDYRFTDVSNKHSAWFWIKMTVFSALLLVKSVIRLITPMNISVIGQSKRSKLIIKKYYKYESMCFNLYSTVRRLTADHFHIFSIKIVSM